MQKKWGRILVTYCLLNYPSSISAVLSASKETGCNVINTYLNLSPYPSVFEDVHILVKV